MAKAPAPVGTKVTACDIIVEEAGKDIQVNIKGANLDIFTTETDELVIWDLDVPGLAGLLFAGERDKWFDSSVTPRKKIDTSP